MRYEKLSTKDFGQLVALEDTYKQSIGETPLTTQQINSLKAAIAKQEIEFYVGNDSGRIVAMCSVCVLFSTYLCCAGGIFEDFYVSEEYRHQGVARGLTQYVFEHLKTRGIQTLWVGCSDSDMGMYQSLGFTLKLGNLLTWSADE